ncbi:MAG TPA: DUF3109 domain-containing protein [Rikenellaceae bacterium]|mgnify:FL=1|nr:DUF3109 domain-containing protein [Rikenellaceae bacterium]
MLNDRFGTIVEIGDILVSEDVICEYFACDYNKCKGACCIEGDSGAPVSESEIEGLEAGYSQYSTLMSEKGRESIRKNGFFTIDRDGDIVTPLVDGDTSECAYTHFLPDGSCLCAIECCHLTKPISCSLYPIRVVELGGGRKGLNLHRQRICKDAFRKGREQGIRVYQFLKGPLTQAFGKEFYEALEQAAKHILYE